MKQTLLAISFLALLTGCATTEAAVPTTDAGDSQHWREARADICRSFAFRALERGLLEEARGYLEEACSADPSDSASHAAMARILLTEGDRSAALTYAQAAAAAAPNDPSVQMVLASALAEEGSEHEATVALEEAWKVSAADPAFSRALLTHYAATGGTKAADSFVRELLAREPDSAQAWALAGDRFLIDGDVEAAEEAYRQALARDADLGVPRSLARRLGRRLDLGDGDPVMAQAAQAEEARDWASATQLYRFLADRDGVTSSMTLSGLARSQYHQGHLQQARGSLARIAEEDWTWRERMLEAKLAIAGESWLDALDALQLVLAERPSLRAAELLRGFVQIRLSEQRGQVASADAADQIDALRLSIQEAR